MNTYFESEIQKKTQIWIMQTRRNAPGFYLETSLYRGSTLSSARFASNELSSISC